jgi:tetratricopeptide (TPR) repeat protein/DNA-binding CsgD family transcriptional regulator
MKNLFSISAIFCLLVLASNTGFSADFYTVDKAVTETRSKKEIQNLLKQEQELFQKTGKLKHKLHLYFIRAFEDYGAESVYKKIENLLWIIEHGDAENQIIVSHANYHLASLLMYLNSYNTAVPFAKEALKLGQKYKQEELIYLTYSLMGTIEYNKKEFVKSISFYKKAQDLAPEGNILFKASMYNNISLCKMGLKDLDASNKYIQKSLQVLNSGPKNLEISLFAVIVQGNLGSNYYKQKKYPEAIQLLQEEVDYYVQNKVDLDQAHNPLRELMELYEKTGNSRKLYETVATVKEIEKNISNTSKSVFYTKLLYDFYLNNQNLPEIKKFGQKYVEKNEFLLDSIANSVEKLNAILYANQVKSIRNQYADRNKLLNATLKSKRNTNSFLVVVFTLLTSIFIIIYIGKTKRERKNRLISIQKEQIQINKRMILENDVKLKQEKITSLALNLNLKKETERAFLLKLKEIRRKKSSDIESIVKELQMNVTNLLQIDSKHRIDHAESELENTRFFKKIKDKHPDVSEQELMLCSYFRLNLNSKEIAQLTNMTSGTIRVYKTKLKSKLGLDSEQNLESYLASFDKG